MDNATLETEVVARLYDGDTFKADNPDQDRLVIKNGRHFLVMDQNGLVPASGVRAPFGLYRDDTRFLDHWNMFVNGTSLRLLSSNVTAGFEADFVYGNQTTNCMQEQSVMVRRQIVLDAHVHEKVTVKNYNPAPVDFELAIAFSGDFVDIFEVRGTRRAKEGRRELPSLTRLGKTKNSPAGKRIKLSYTGVDGIPMQTVVDVRSRLDFTYSADGMLRIPVQLNPGQSRELDITIRTAVARETKRRIAPGRFDDAKEHARKQFSDWLGKAVSIKTENSKLNRLIDQAFLDLFILQQPVPGGTALAAGLPWFACAFGRDQAIAAMQILPFLPETARDVVVNLAHNQGKEHNPYKEEKPGKIMHELRLGEMARVGETPFSPYYGTVDATPLWLMLFSRYVEWSGDMELARRLWPNVEAALDYLKAETEASGYLTYGGTGNTTALSNQGWKDSFDSITYSSAELAMAPIALVEAQGYLYAALKGCERIARSLKRGKRAANLKTLAATLRRRFQKDFWMKEKDFPALALDGAKRQCDVVSSNPGHLIGTGLLSITQEKRVTERLMEEDMLSNWGIRTLSSKESAYNPMSYHNGSIWPHDNAMIVDGMSHSEQTPFGETSAAHTILSALVSLAEYRPDGRLPELVCGFASDTREGPINYPISCSPQAWSAGAPLQIIAACLGISYDADSNSVLISNPSIPEWMGTVKVHNLRFGKYRLDLTYQRQDGKTVFIVDSKSKALKVVNSST